MNKKLLIIGASGAVGTRIIKMLESQNKYSVYRASSQSRTNNIHCDLNDHSTFTKLKDFDYIINASDPYLALPFALIEYCLREGLTLWETCADPVIIKECIEKYRGSSGGWKGRVIIGMGIFPGVSNLLADFLIRSTQAKKAGLTLFIQASPLSQAGSSTCELMAQHLSYPALVWQKDKFIEQKTLELSRPIKFGESKLRGLRLFFPEVSMFKDKQKIESIESFLVPNPKILIFSLKGLGLLFPSKPGMYSKILINMTSNFLKLVRKYILGSIKSRVAIRWQLTDEKNQKHHITLTCPDGLTSLAAAIKSCLLLESQELMTASGIHLPHEIFRWEDIEKSYLKELPMDRFEMS